MDNGSHIKEVSTRPVWWHEPAREDDSRGDYYCYYAESYIDTTDETIEHFFFFVIWLASSSCVCCICRCDRFYVISTRRVFYIYKKPHHRDEGDTYICEDFRCHKFYYIAIRAQFIFFCKYFIIFILLFDLPYILPQWRRDRVFSVYQIQSLV